MTEATRNNTTELAALRAKRAALRAKRERACAEAEAAMRVAAELLAAIDELTAQELTAKEAQGEPFWLDEPPIPMAEDTMNTNPNPRLVALLEAEPDDGIVSALAAVKAELIRRWDDDELEEEFVAAVHAVPANERPIAFAPIAREVVRRGHSLLHGLDGENARRLARGQRPAGQALEMAHFGACPTCRREGECLTVSRTHWMCCGECSTCWLIGHNLFSHRTEGEEREQNIARLERCRVVEDDLLWTWKAAAEDTPTRASANLPF